jgi:hypothetical protein
MKTLIAPRFAICFSIAGVVILAMASAALGETCAAHKLPCKDGLWCEYPTGHCGQTDIEGKCLQVHGACTANYLPVCGCDKRTYGNDCDRRSMKVQKAHDGAC